ncbi:MAG TPA: hypothetical protein DDZ89_01740 [Clostridiales bacterium]|nr:hypothetical protein [Clostridiales bacterium]
MAFTIILLIGLGIFEIKRILEDKDIKQVVLYCIFSVITIAFCIWFFTSDIEHSFSYELFDLLGILERQ